MLYLMGAGRQSEKVSNIALLLEYSVVTRI